MNMKRIFNKASLSVTASIAAAALLAAPMAHATDQSSESTTLTANVMPLVVVGNLPKVEAFGDINPLSVSHGKIGKTLDASDIILEQNAGGSNKLKISTSTQYWVHGVQGNQAVLAPTGTPDGSISPSKTPYVPFSVYCHFCGPDAPNHIISPTYNSGPISPTHVVYVLNEYSSMSACQQQPASCAFLVGSGPKDTPIPAAGQYTGKITVTVSTQAPYTVISREIKLMRIATLLSIGILAGASAALPAFADSVKETAVIQLTASVGNALNASGINGIMTVSPDHQQASPARFGQIYDNNGMPIEVTTVSNFVNKKGQAAIVEGKEIVPVIVLCKPCGDNSQPEVFSPIQHNKRLIQIQGKDSTYGACQQSPAFCYTRLPQALPHQQHLKANGQLYSGGMTMTIKPEL